MTGNILSAIKKQLNRLNWWIIAIFLIAFLLQAGIFAFVLGSLLQLPTNSWLSGLLVTSFILLSAGAMVFFVTDRTRTSIQRSTAKNIDYEFHQLRAANKRAQALREMASTLRATLSFERVVEEALDVCSVALEEMGIPKQSFVGAVFLYDKDELVPIASRRFPNVDLDRRLPGDHGLISHALRQAEVTVTDNPHQDPGLRSFHAFKNSVTVVCIPLRAGFQIFGAMIIGSGTAVQFNQEHFDLFAAVADQAVIALQNATLFQNLEAEKQRLIEADEEARKELARSLHDGPTQSIAAIAMRVNFIKTLVNRDPSQAISELQKVEELAKQTSKDVRGMLFTLRPLVLETQGLGAAIETVMARIRESDGLNLRLVGAEAGDLLSESAQSVVFSIVEEALGNARKYSEAELIEVRFWREDNLFVARVQDNGKGFDVQAVNDNYSSRGSLGMVNMRERAERIDGSWRIESQPGKGTTMYLVVPLDKHGR